MPLPRTLDELALALAQLRTSAGAPSFAEIARRIGAIRGGEEPAKVTVYDCFRPGRRRVDPDLVRDIVLALDTGDTAAQTWQRTAAALNGERLAPHVQVTVSARGDAGHRIGRESLLAAIDPDADVVVLSGLGGMGKSTLASALIGGRRALTVELRESEPDRAHAGPVEVIRRMLGALGLRSVPYDLARLRERLAAAAAGTLIVLEDAVSTERLAALIVPGVRYLVTSRLDLGSLNVNPAVHGLRVEHIAVPPLGDEQALRLLAHLITEDAAADRAAPDDAALRRIVAVSGGLPIDVAMLAGVVREHPGWTFDDLASRFESEPRASRIRPVLEAATRALDEEDAEFLADAALLDREVDLELLRAVRPDVEASVRRLRSRHLLDVSDGAVQMHATVFAFVREQSIALRPESVRARQVDRIAEELLHQIDADEDAVAHRIGTVLAVAEAARAYGLDAMCVRLALAAHPVLSRWALWAPSLRLHDLAARGRDLSDIPELALGIAHSAEKLGRFDEALVILHRVRRVASGSALARTWNQIGNVQRWTSHFDDALDAYQTAMRIAREQGDPVVEGRALGNHADTLRIVARYADAEREYAQALTIAESAGDGLNIGIIRSNRALLWTATGRLDSADAELTAMLAADGGRALPSVRMIRALVAEARGDDAAARTLVDDALAVVETTGEYGPSADVLLLDARLLARSGRAEQAASAAREVLDDAQRTGSGLVATEAANTLAEIHLALLGPDGDDSGILDQVFGYATEAVSIADLTGDRAEVARGWSAVAAVARRRGAVEEADRLAARASALYVEIGHRLASTA